MALLLLLLGLGVVFLGARLEDTGWTGWALPALIVGGLFVFGAGWSAREIPHDHWREDQTFEQGPPEGKPLLAASLLAVLVLGVLIAGALWFGRADGYASWLRAPW